MFYTIEYFKLEEFLCKCCGEAGGYPAALLVVWLDILRRAWGAPILINSGKRCEAHNSEVGGSPKSRHLAGLAADIRPSESKALREFIILAKRMRGVILNGNGWELKEYPTFVHVGIPRRSELGKYGADITKDWLGKREVFI